MSPTTIKGAFFYLLEGSLEALSLSPPFVTTSKLKDFPKYPAKALDLLVFGGDPLDLHFHQTNLETTHSSLGDLVVLGSLEPRTLFVFSKLWELEDSESWRLPRFGEDPPSCGVCLILIKVLVVNLNVNIVTCAPPRWWKVTREIRCAI